MSKKTGKGVPAGFREFTERVHRDGQASTTVSELMGWFRSRKFDAESLHKKINDSSEALEAEGYGILMTIDDEVTLAQEVLYLAEGPVELEEQITLTFELRLAVYWSSLPDDNDDYVDEWDDEYDEGNQERTFTQWWIGLSRERVLTNGDLTMKDGSFFMRARRRDDLPDYTLQSGEEIYSALLEMVATANCNTLWLVEDGPDEKVKMLGRVDMKIANQFKSAVEQHAEKVRAES